MRRVPTALALLALCALALPALAGASQLLARDASEITLQVNRAGDAVITYTKPNGKIVRLLASGAIDARHPESRRPQEHFTLDYSGGWKTRGKAVWKRFVDRCIPYDGPSLDLVVTACTAPDGSFWALQEWRRMLPNYGYEPWRPRQNANELHLSHFTGDLAEIEAHADWVFWGSRAHHHLFGGLTYRGKSVHGFDATPAGNPLDRHGRNVYLDVLNSAHGSGWKRENSFLAQRPSGTFCYGFFSNEPRGSYPPGPTRPPAQGERYRLTVRGPGVTPIVRWEGAGLPDYDAANPALVAHEVSKRQRENELFAGAKHCQKR